MLVVVLDAPDCVVSVVAVVLLAGLVVVVSDWLKTSKGVESKSQKSMMRLKEAIDKASVHYVGSGFQFRTKGGIAFCTLTQNRFILRKQTSN